LPSGAVLVGHTYVAVIQDHVSAYRITDGHPMWTATCPRHGDFPALKADKVTCGKTTYQVTEAGIKTA
jgi:hypothetical protein